MALETLKGIKKIGEFNIVDICDLKEKTLDKSNVDGKEITLEGEQWYKFFEREVRASSFIYVRHDVNSLSFNIQNGPIKENGVNGCQVDTIIETATVMLEGLNSKFPCHDNVQAIIHLKQALSHLENRKKERESRNVEGTSQA